MKLGKRVGVKIMYYVNDFNNVSIITFLEKEIKASITKNIRSDVWELTTGSIYNSIGLWT